MNRSDPKIEAAAEAIYNCLTGSKAYPWQPGGNSHKQDEARMYAEAAIAGLAGMEADPVTAGEIKTWKERCIEAGDSPIYGHSCSAYDLARDAEIADLRATVAKYEARMLRMATCAGEFARDASLAERGTVGEPVVVPTPDQIAANLKNAMRGMQCPLCGWDRPHDHTPKEITIYRNGVKYGARQQKLAGADDQSHAQDERHDPSAIGTGSGAGAHEHHEHRAAEPSAHGCAGGGDGEGNGVSDCSEVRAAVAPHPAPIGDGGLPVQAKEGGQ